MGSAPIAFESQKGFAGFQFTIKSSLSGHGILNTNGTNGTL